MPEKVRPWFSPAGGDRPAVPPPLRDDDGNFQLPRPSPNGKYAIEFVETRKHRMLYRWIQLHPRKVLLDIESGFQPDPDGAGASDARSYAEDAYANWSKDSRYVVIADEIKHGSGQTAVAFLAAPGRAEEIILPHDQMFHATGEKWARGRFWFDEWGEDGALTLTLIGEVPSRIQDVPDRVRLENASYTIHLRRKGHRYVIVKVEKD